MREKPRESQNKSYIASETCFGVMAIVAVIDHSFVILNLFQDNEPRSHVILKQVQDDEEHTEIPLPQAGGVRGGHMPVGRGCDA